MNKQLYCHMLEAKYNIQQLKLMRKEAYKTLTNEAYKILIDIDNEKERYTIDLDTKGLREALKEINGCNYSIKMYQAEGRMIIDSLHDHKNKD